MFHGHSVHNSSTTCYTNNYLEKKKSIHQIKCIVSQEKNCGFFNNFTKEQNSCVIKCNTGNDVEPNFKEL